MSANPPIDLDRQRGMVAQKATDLRRLLAAVRSNQEELKAHQADLEAQLLAAPAESWPEAAGKARYLLEILADSPAGMDPRRQRLIKAVLADFAKLAGNTD